MSGELSSGADARVELGTPGGGAAATLWWNQVPALAGEKLGVIGEFAAASEHAALEVLAAATGRLRTEGCTLAVGPMDGNTWRKYRLVTAAGTEPPFFMEPVNPPEWPEWWRAAGFGILAEYYSSATQDLGKSDARLAGVTARLTAAGMTIRPLDPACFEEELGRIHDVSVESFQENFLYTPLPRAEFIAQYRTVQTRVRPELVRLAEQQGRAVGYVFALPDWAQAQRGEPITTVIVKTLAVRPGRAYAGLGAWLLGDVHAAAERLGYRRAIHALMHETNQSRNLSAHYAETIRRYALFSRRL
jgi:predicted N-acetyltransferase YhbS